MHRRRESAALRRRRATADVRPQRGACARRADVTRTVAARQTSSVGGRSNRLRSVAVPAAACYSHPVFSKNICSSACVAGFVGRRHVRSGRRERLIRRRCIRVASYSPGAAGFRVPLRRCARVVFRCTGVAPMSHPNRRAPVRSMWTHRARFYGASSAAGGGASETRHDALTKKRGGRRGAPLIQQCAIMCDVAVALAFVIFCVRFLIPINISPRTPTCKPTADCQHQTCACSECCDL